jgi:hypothetical protein
VRREAFADERKDHRYCEMVEDASPGWVPDGGAPAEKHAQPPRNRSI